MSKRTTYYKAFQLSIRLNEQRRVTMGFILDGSFEYYKELKSTRCKRVDLCLPQNYFLLKNQRKHIWMYNRIIIEEGERSYFSLLKKG